MSWKCCLSRLLTASLAALVVPAAAEAAGADCTGITALKDAPALESAKVSGAKKVFFVKGGSEDEACPADTAACRRRAFVVPGDAVVVSGRTVDFACATFVGGQGVETSGWLPKEAVEVEAALAPEAPGAAPTPSDWAGTWVRQEARITIKPGAQSGARDALAIHGDATWGAEDPDRVKRGAVNIGEIEGLVRPKGGRLSFAMGDDGKSEPVTKGDDTTCKVWMARVGPYLLVDDDNACGGMNVTFRGTYARH